MTKQEQKRLRSIAGKIAIYMTRTGSNFHDSLVDYVLTNDEIDTIRGLIKQVETNDGSVKFLVY